MRLSDSSLKSKIKSDFASVPYPKGAITPESEGYINLEAQQIGSFFQGKDWQSITLSALNEEYIGDPAACLNFMTPTAFRYYLPSYLLICLEHNIRSNNILPSTIWRLTLNPDNAEDKAQFMGRFSPYNEARKQDIASFLVLMREYFDADDNDPQIALDRYWSIFLDRTVLPRLRK